MGLLNHQNVAETRLTAVLQDAVQLAETGVLAAFDTLQRRDGADDGLGDSCRLQGFALHVVVFHGDDVWLDNNHRRVLTVNAFNQVAAQRGFTRTGLADNRQKATVAGGLEQRFTHVADIRRGEHIVRALHGFIGKRVTEKAKRFFGCWK